LAYNTIVKHTILGIPVVTFEDVTDIVSLNPDIDDVVKVTVFYDYNSGFPLYEDRYKVIINNETQSHTITVSDIHSLGKGLGPNTHAEILNQDTEIKSEVDILKTRSSGGTWSAWNDSIGRDNPTGTANTLCYDKVDADTYKFGIDGSGGTCLT